MIWIALAAAAAASSHSITGAFGFQLGAVPAQVGSCVKQDYPDGAQMFVCPHGGFFERVFIHTRRNVATRISGVKVYSGEDTKAAHDSCFRDLLSIKATLDDKYPRLQAATHLDGVNFELSEQLLAGLAYGRSISGKCEEESVDAPNGSKFVGLWLNYGISADESAALTRKDDAERLKRKGLDRDSL